MLAGILCLVDLLRHRCRAVRAGGAAHRTVCDVVSQKDERRSAGGDWPSRGGGGRGRWSGTPRVVGATFHGGYPPVLRSSMSVLRVWRYCVQSAMERRLQAPRLVVGDRQRWWQRPWQWRRATFCPPCGPTKPYRWHEM